MVVVAVDADDARTVNGGVENLCGLKVCGDEYTGVDALLSTLCGDGIRQIAGRRATDSAKSKFFRSGKSGATTRSLNDSEGKQTASFLI